MAVAAAAVVVAAAVAISRCETFCNLAIRRIEKGIAADNVMARSMFPEEAVPVPAQNRF